VIEIPGLIDQEDVRESQPEQARCHAVEQADRHQESACAQQREHDVHAGARERLGPRTAVVLEMKWRFREVAVDPTVCEVAADLDEHAGAERHAKYDEQADVDRREEPLAQGHGGGGAGRRNGCHRTFCRQ
jgi:hypothetical protein